MVLTVNTYKNVQVLQVTADLSSVSTSQLYQGDICCFCEFWV